MSSRVLLVVIGCVLVAAAPGLAQEADAVEQAKRHVEQAEQHYSLAEFPAAVREFKAAYRLVPRAGILFNLGQCYLQMKDYANAEFSYRAYLRASPDAGNKALVEELITQAHAAAEEEARLRREAEAAARASSDSAVLAAGLTTASLGGAVGLVSLLGVGLVELLFWSDLGGEDARAGWFWAEKALGAAAAAGIVAVVVGGSLATASLVE